MSNERYIVSLWNAAPFDFGKSDTERVSRAHALRCSSTYALDLQVVDTQDQKVIARYTRRGTEVKGIHPAELYKEYLKLSKERMMPAAEPELAEPIKTRRGRPKKAPK